MLRTHPGWHDALSRQPWAPEVITYLEHLFPKEGRRWGAKHSPQFKFSVSELLFWAIVSEHVRMSWACFWFSRKEKEERKNCRTHSWGGKRHLCMCQPFYHSRQFILVECDLYPLLSWREALHRERFCGCPPTRETSNTLMIEFVFRNLKKCNFI